MEVNQEALHNLEKSHVALKDSLAHGDVIYGEYLGPFCEACSDDEIPGVNTGFGGSANTRTDKVEALQETLLREFNSGVLVSPSSFSTQRLQASLSNGHITPESLDRRPDFSEGLPVHDLVSLNCMPVAWTRAAMLIRLNSLVVGVSGVRRCIVERILQLLELDIIPRIPMHGSISACGDLAPLSYIGSAIQGKANVTCTVGALSGKNDIVSARSAIEAAGLHAEKVEAKEALAIMNGTAVSCAVGALALHDTHGLVVMSKVLTAMSVEALGGTDESFDSFFAMVRPHPGQIDASRSIRGFLRGSQLINEDREGGAATLKQDRYSIRTAAQWLSPVLEDLQLAHQQLTVECNSVTDNPLIDIGSGPVTRHLHGGNFQARAVTSAMEKVRISLQSVGRLLFSQCTETINPATSQGLPPNLVADEPSESFVMKSVDIMVAALLSELNFLANPVGTHVQTAEMGNQALNSLALISARYALTAVDITAKLVSAHLLVACQALDLRVMLRLFGQAVQSQMHLFARDWYERLHSEKGRPCDTWLLYGAADEIKELEDALWQKFRARYEETPTCDSHERFYTIARDLQSVVVAHTFKYPISRLQPQSPTRDIPSVLEEWTQSVADIVIRTFASTKESYLAAPDPHPFLGRASWKMYSFVRHQLKVPFLTTETLRGRAPSKKPSHDGMDGVSHANSLNGTNGINGLNGATYTNGFSKSHLAPPKEIPAEPMPTVGAYVTQIYMAVHSGELYAQAIDCLEDTLFADAMG